MPLYRNAVGEEKKSKLYVWSETDGGASKKIAVITAHGGEAKVNGMADTPDVRLVFYSPHGHILSDPSLEAVVAGGVEPCGDPVSSRSSQDYELGKYTNTKSNPGRFDNKHNKAGENYENVAGLLERFQSAHATALGLIEAIQDAEASGAASDQMMIQKAEQQALAARYATLPMDIITIRYRRFTSDPKLSDVLKLLHANGFDYDEIHCNFCRGAKEAYSAPRSALV